MKARVRNFRGCRAAEIELAPVALVAGRNGAGKTSIAQGVAAALIGDPLIGGLTTKSGTAAMVHDGTNAASVELEGDNGQVRVLWPEAQATAKGIAPQASAYAAGAASIAELDARAGGAVLADYLHADPTRDDLAAALAEAGFDDAAVVDAVWKLLDEHGWDDAHTLRRDHGAELKGRWRQVTGQNWGSRIGASWHPADWTIDLEDLAEDALSAAVASARTAHDAAIGRAAVSSAQRERVAAEADTLEARKFSLRTAEAEAEKIAAELDAAKAARAVLPAGRTGAPMPCPHCGGLLDLQRVNLAEMRLVAAEVIEPAELRKRQRAIADADGTVSRLQGEVGRADHTVEIARAQMQQASEAKHRLANLPAAGPEVDTAAARGALERATVRERAWRQQRDADELHQRIADNDALLKILAGDGLRAAKLARVLDAFNRTSLAELTAAADWPAVEITPDMAISAGGRPYRLLSTSEQYRVRVTLQVAMARLDGSDALVIDAADLLDAPARSGLIALLDTAGLPALVCMTASRASQVPDLARAGLGASYWIEDGAAAAFAEPGEAAA